MTASQLTRPAVTVIGVRHHSPACARLVATTINTVRPAYVLVEGPADMNDRLDELRLDHQLPIAVFTSYRDGAESGASWSPFCEYSPEWVALRSAAEVGAEFRFIDLPAWHPAFHDRANRYADADRRYADVVDRLCREFGVDNVDTLWDHLAESVSDPTSTPILADRLTAYFAALRGDAVASPSDVDRENYMTQWVRAAIAHAAGRPIVVVCGGFHRPALESALAVDPASPPESALALASGSGSAGSGSAGSASASDDSGSVGSGSAGSGSDESVVWPALPERSGRHDSFLVPFSFKRLDAFDGYQSGMPSPEYYQQLWQHGPAEAARRLIETVTTRLRQRRQPISTADLIAAHATALALARVRGHDQPARTDVLDGLVSTLVGEALDRPPPWTGWGRLEPGTHPVIVEMIAALSGTRVGTLDPRTPLPPLVHDVTATLERHGLAGNATIRLDLTKPADRVRSVILHQLRVLAIPGIECHHGATPGGDATERWQVTPVDRLVPLIEAGSYGATLGTAATARVEEQVRSAGPDIERLAGTLLDAALCGFAALPGRVLAAIQPTIAGVGELAPLGRVLSTVLALWRHDRLYELADSDTLAVVMSACVQRILWLAEGIHGGPAPADNPRLHALVAARDTVRYAAAVPGIDRDTARAVMSRIAACDTAPPDLRGAAFGFVHSLPPESPLSVATAPALGSTTALGSVPALGSAPARGSTTARASGAEDSAAAASEAARTDLERAVRGASNVATLGDWLAGLFALARAESLDAEPDPPADPSRAAGLLGLLDTLVAAMTEHDFLVALPALRQAFAWFPPRERETIARRLLAQHGVTASGPGLVRLNDDPYATARARELDAFVDALLIREGLLPDGTAT